MKPFLLGALSALVLVFGIAAVSNPPTPPPTQPKMTIDLLSIPHVVRYEMEEYFRVDVSPDLINWETVSRHNQKPVMLSSNACFDLWDGTRSFPQLFTRTVKETKLEWDTGTFSDKYRVGVIIHRK